MTSEYAISDVRDVGLIQTPSITGATLEIMVVVVGTVGNIRVMLIVAMMRSLF